MRLLVVNGDDFGLARGVNEGIIEAHTRGILTSTSLMVLRPAAEEAGALARAHSKLSVGLHFEEDGATELNDPVQAERALLAQLERFHRLVGRNPTHLDSHHHVHAEGDRMVTFKSFASRWGIPLRNDGQVAYIGGFWAQWEPGVTNLDYIRRPFLRHLVDAEVGEGFTELACHPARVSEDLDSNYLHEREVELQTLTEAGLREELQGAGVRLVSYHDWPSPGRSDASQ